MAETTPGETISDDLQDAFVAEASAKETQILGVADGLLQAGTHALGAALMAGFKQHVALAGGSIGAACETALAQLDTQLETTLKVQFDALIAVAKAHELKVPTL